MNDDIFEGNWKQMKGQLREWWGELTDDDIEKIGGKKDRLLGTLQQRYGYSREEAEREMDMRFRSAGSRY
jgi:uncharacterized protein YjbJ (UPF0337 family)